MLGRVSFTTSSFKDWTPAVKATAPEKVKKVKAPPKEVHSHFHIYASYYDHDPEWKEILTKCVYNKFPVGFRYHDHVISYRKTGKTYTYTPLDVSKETADAIVNFIRVYGSLYTTQDKYRFVEPEPREEVVINWETSKANLRISLLQKFCYHCAKTIPLTLEKREELFSILMIGLSVGNITAGDVVLENNEIVSVKSVRYENGNFFCGFIRPIK